MTNILLSSVGRRPYLVRGFREALAATGVDGVVIAADLDPLSPARAFADDFVQAPALTDDAYPDWLASLLADRGIGLAVSINDFELSEWAHLPETPEWSALVRLSAASQQLAPVHPAATLRNRLSNRNHYLGRAHLGTLLYHH